MNIIIFGATGMVGQGVLRECLADPSVQKVLTVGRTTTGVQSPKLEELKHKDLWDYTSVEYALIGYDACYFCLGVSAADVSGADYIKLNFDLPVAAAKAVLKQNPGMVFTYISGAGTDSTEKGRTMWARVKGKTENALAALPFKSVYLFRPGIIEPMHGAVSKTRSYRIFYGLSRPFLPVLRSLFPNFILTTVQVGSAMLNVTKHGYPKKILEIRDIREASELR